MSFIRQIVFYLFVAAGLGGALWAYFYLRNTKQPSLKAGDVIPDSAVCVMSTRNFNSLANKLNNQSLIWNELVNVEEFNGIKKQLRFFDSIIHESEVLEPFFHDHAVELAFYSTPGGLNYFLVFNLNDVAQADDFTAELGRAIRGFSAKEDGYGFKGPGAECYVKLHRGVVAISDAPELIRNAFASKNRKLAKNPHFAQLSELNKEDDLLNGYIDHALLNSAEKNTQVHSRTLLFNGHSTCNVTIEPDEISVNGFNKPDPGSLFNVLASQQSQAADFFQALPFNTIAFKAYGFGNFSLLRKNLNIGKTESSFWKRTNDSAMFNAEEEFYNAIGTKLIGISLKQNNLVSSALLIDIGDTAKIRELTRYMADTIIMVQNTQLARLPDRAGNLAAESFGNLFPIDPHFAFAYDHYFVLLEDRAAADYYINALKTNAVLTENDLFVDYAKENTGLQFNYLFYTSPDRNASLPGELFGFLKEKDLKHFEKLSDLCISVTNYKNLLQFRANVRYRQARGSKGPEGLWTFAADTVISSGAWPFVNHKTGENELVFQDMANTLYLVNATGNPIWKKKIDEPLRSDIFTVDAFRNSKFQILFSTENYLHLIDRNGEYVKGFPVKLPARATNRLTLLDYEGKKEYRLFIACADKQIYNYNISGAKNEGFAPVKTKEIVHETIKYVKVGLSDYLITADTEGAIYVFSRKGEGRIDLTNKLTENCSDFFVDAGAGLKDTKIVYLDDKNSSLGKISLEDKKEMIRLGDEMEQARVSFDLVDDDKKTDMLIASAAGAYVYDLAGIRLLGFHNEESSFNDLEYMMDLDRSMFIACNYEKKEALLIDPLSGKVKGKHTATQRPLVLDIFREGKKYLVMVNGATLSCVRND